MVALTPIIACPECGDAVEVSRDKLDSETKRQMLRCADPRHGPHGLVWLPSATAVAATNPGQDPLMITHDVPNRLLGCVHAGDRWLEYGIVEQRFRTAYPDAYRVLVKAYSHSARNPVRGGTDLDPVRGGTVSNRFSHILSGLADEGLVAKAWGKGTGFWHYLSPVTYWAPVPAPPEGERTTWKEYATANQLDPDVWDLGDDQ